MIGEWPYNISKGKSCLHEYNNKRITDSQHMCWLPWIVLYLSCYALFLSMGSKNGRQWIHMNSRMVENGYIWIVEWQTMDTYG